MKWLLISGLFVVVLGGHFLYVTRPLSTAGDSGPWAAIELVQPEGSRLSRYIRPGEQWLGLSYALAGGFAAFCLGRVVAARRQALVTSAGGLALSGLVWASVCFLVGCCGSPMLPIYLGLLGPRFLGVTKPLTFALTLVSVLIGYRIVRKRTSICGCASVPCGGG